MQKAYFLLRGDANAYHVGAAIAERPPIVGRPDTAMRVRKCADEGACRGAALSIEVAGDSWTDNLELFDMLDMFNPFASCYLLCIEGLSAEDLKDMTIVLDALETQVPEPGPVHVEVRNHLMICLREIIGLDKALYLRRLGSGSTLVCQRLNSPTPSEASLMLPPEAEKLSKAMDIAKDAAVTQASRAVTQASRAATQAVASGTAPRAVALCDDVQTSGSPADKWEWMAARGLSFNPSKTAASFYLGHAVAAADAEEVWSAAADVWSDMMQKFYSRMQTKSND